MLLIIIFIENMDKSLLGNAKKENEAVQEAKNMVL